MMEGHAFIASVLCGVFAVVFWYAIDALRTALNARAVANGLLDILWWLTVAGIFSVCMWEIISLRIRFFEFLGVGIGAISCNFIFGKPLNWLFGLIFGIFLKIIQFIFKILLTPWTFLYKILIVGIFGKIKKGIKNDRPKKEAD